MGQVTYPLPAKYKHCVPSSQNGMHTPEIESSTRKPLIGSRGARISHSASCLSLIFENPVVAIRSCSPIQTDRLFFAPEWPAVSCAGRSWRTSQIRNFLSREVVTMSEPFALQDIDWTISPSLRFNLEDPASISQILIVKSPEAVARTFAAAGLKRTWPTFLQACQRTCAAHKLH